MVVCIFKLLFARSQATLNGNQQTAKYVSVAIDLENKDSAALQC